MGSDDLIICIGDIHGHLDKLRILWDKLEHELTAETVYNAIVVFLGDYCDKGPNTRGVLDYLIELEEKRRPGSTIFLAGNHDFGMAAYLGCLPINSLPEDFNLDETNTRKYRSGYFTKKVEGGMHYMGRRWGGSMSYKSKYTFESYGVKFMYTDAARNQLISAVPQKHKDFLQRMHWVYESYLPACDPPRVICTHAGLSADNAEAQIAALKERDLFDEYIRTDREHLDRLSFLSGRREVTNPPEELEESALLVSGHHGYVKVKKNRIIMDNNAGSANKDIKAIVLPTKLII